jgi:polyvinyl alcohol dehydrogenase (cytochrome)
MKMQRNTGLMAVLAAVTMLAQAAVADAAPQGAALYAQHCESCHNGSVAKAPQRTMLEIMSPASILRAMQAGVMQSQAAAMSAVEQQLLAEFLTGRPLIASGSMRAAPVCSAESAVFDFAAPPDTRGWGVDSGNRRFFDAGIAGLTAADLPNLELKWAFAFPDALRARSQPATAGGALFVGSQDGTVYALEQHSGCVRWMFQASAEVRTGIVVEPWAPGERVEPRLFFGDLLGNVYAVSAVSGALMWRDRPDDHPSLTITAAPALHEGRLYVSLSSLEVTAAADPGYACCTFRGGVAVYDASTGEHIATHHTIDELPRVVGKNAAGTDRIAPSGAPVWNTPTLDPRRGVLYVGTGENYSSPANATSDAILALSLTDGTIVWSQQMTSGDAWNMGCETEERINCPPEDGPDYDFGAATILVTTSSGRDLVLAGQKSGEVFALDPDRGGAIVWRRKLGKGGIQGGVHFGMTVDGDTLYVPMSDFDGGPRWPGKPSPGMFAVDIPTGEQLWFTETDDRCSGREYCQPGLSAAASSLPGGVVAGAMDGVLRAYSKATGAVIWEHDSVRDYATTDGGSAPRWLLRWRGRTRVQGRYAVCHIRVWHLLPYARQRAAGLWPACRRWTLSTPEPTV